MAILFKQDFREASNNCWKCKLYDEEHEEKQRDTHFKQANNTLATIIKDCEKIISGAAPSSKAYVDATETKKIAEGAQIECSGCSFRDTKIKNYLETYGLKAD